MVAGSLVRHLLVVAALVSSVPAAGGKWEAAKEVARAEAAEGEFFTSSLFRSLTPDEVKGVWQETFAEDPGNIDDSIQDLLSLADIAKDEWGRQMAINLELLFVLAQGCFNGADGGRRPGSVITEHVSVKIGHKDPKKLLKEIELDFSSGVPEKLQRWMIELTWAFAAYLQGLGRVHATSWRFNVNQRVPDSWLTPRFAWGKVLTVNNGAKG